VIQMNESQILLADYVKTGSESAFRELVSRYINLVHSTALRLVNGDDHLAEDITQTVFVDLARKAHTLSRDVMLGGWLHRDTCFVAGTTMRGERRRQFRERQAVAMSIPADHTAANLALVAPILDEAINQLEPDDRQAILLRFFEQLEYRAVGEAMGSNEDAARMRVTRALDKLHAMLKNRGVALSAVALGAALATGAVSAAPFGLAATVAGGALASVASAGASATLFKFMTLTKLKIAVVTAIAVAAVAVPVVVQHQSLAKLRDENQALQQQAAQLDALQSENERLSNLVVQAGTRPPVSEEQARELARLRNVVGKLRDQTNQMGTELAKMRQFGGGQMGMGFGKRMLHMTMPEFAKFIAGVLQAPVADQTGLTGTYDIEMTPPRLGGEDGKLERVTGILLSELGLQLTPFAGPFSADEQDFDKEVPAMNMQRLPDGSYTNIESEAAIAAKARWVYNLRRVQMPDGSYTTVTNLSVTPGNSNGGYALKVDHSDAPGLKPSNGEDLPAGVYDVDTPGIASAVANKLRLIDASKQQWALEFRKQNTDTPMWQDIEPYLPRRGADYNEYTNAPEGRYIINSVATKPQIRANVLPTDAFVANAAGAEFDNSVTSKANACINNLRLIDASKQQWALEFRKQSTDTPTADDLRPYLGRGVNGELPVCPDGGVYTFGTVGEKPTCSVQGHVLP
jgi:RNA polymerase sigma factor (sigma-70 family)